MFGLAKLFSTETKAASKKSSFRPQLESLEQREVLSTASASLHAVTGASGFEYGYFLQTTAGKSPMLTVSYTILGNEGCGSFTFPQNTAGTPNGIQTFSAGLDTKGNPDVFVKAADGSFWEWDSAWTKIRMPGTAQVESFAAVNGGKVYAIFQDGSLNEFNGSKWLHVYGTGTVTGLDAVTDKRGHDAIFIENADDSFGEVYNPTGGMMGGLPLNQVFVGNYTQLAAADKLTVTIGGRKITTTFSTVENFSAGTDANGYADVFATFLGGTLEKNILGTWSTVAAAGTFQSYSATDSGVAWMVDGNGQLARYNGSTIVSGQPQGEGGTLRSIAAANSYDVYTTFSNGGDIDITLLDPNANNLPQVYQVGNTPN